MAVQQITHKKITKFDTSNPNYKETPKPKVEVSGNVREDEEVKLQKESETPPPAEAAPAVPGMPPEGGSPPPAPGECFEWIDSNPKHVDAIIEKHVFNGLFYVWGVS